MATATTTTTMTSTTKDIMKESPPTTPSAPTKTSKKLSRSASLERIKKFNTYLCSQNFYILPALLTWLRAPHDKLQDSLERFIAILKFMLFTTFLPRQAIKLLGATMRLAREQIADILDSKRFIKMAAYAALSIVFLQLGVCVYYLAGVMQSTGFVFMCTCLYLITQMNFSCLRFFLREKEVTHLIGGKVVPVQKRLSRRDILGKRTISNMNLI